MQFDQEQLKIFLRFLCGDQTSKNFTNLIGNLDDNHLYFSMRIMHRYDMTPARSLFGSLSKAASFNLSDRMQNACRKEIDLIIGEPRDEEMFGDFRLIFSLRKDRFLFSKLIESWDFPFAERSVESVIRSNLAVALVSNVVSIRDIANRVSSEQMG